MLATRPEVLENILVNYVNDRIDRAANGLRVVAADVAPKDTTALAESMDVTTESTDSSVVFSVRANDDETDEYGFYQDVGTGPHEITVKDAAVLSDGVTFFGTSVNHPGSTKNVGWFSDVDWAAELVRAFD